METLRKICDYLTPGKWYFCHLENGRIVYTDWALDWIRWANTQKVVVSSSEGFVGSEQIAILVEFRACDIRFARTKRPSFSRKFYRVSVIGGTLDGSIKNVRTLEEAEALASKWGKISWS